MTVINWGGTVGTWSMESDMRQEYDNRTQSCHGQSIWQDIIS